MPALFCGVTPWADKHKSVLSLDVQRLGICLEPKKDCGLQNLAVRKFPLGYTISWPVGDLKDPLGFI